MCTGAVAFIQCRINYSNIGNWGAIHRDQPCAFEACAPIAYFSTCSPFSDGVQDEMVINSNESHSAAWEQSFEVTIHVDEFLKCIVVGGREKVHLFNIMSGRDLVLRDSLCIAAR